MIFRCNRQNSGLAMRVGGRVLSYKRLGRQFLQVSEVWPNVGRMLAECQSEIVRLVRTGWSRA